MVLETRTLKMGFMCLGSVWKILLTMMISFTQRYFSSVKDRMQMEGRALVDNMELVLS